jgi:glutamine synthetase
MPPFKDKQTVMDSLRSSGASHAKVAVTDIDGILRGKYLSSGKLESALESGFGFCDVVLGWDSNDQLYDNTRFTGWHTAYPDAWVRVLPQTARALPFEQGMLFFLCEFTGKAEAICPRGLLRRVLERAHSMGFEPYGALEYEFFLFDETPDSVRAKHYQNLQPWTPGFFGYSTLRTSVHAEFYQQLLAQCEAMDTPIEGLHTETGPGVMEAALTVDKLLEAADKAILFKTFTKVLAQRNGLMATFMAKWSNKYPGQSGHIHLSLKDRQSGDSAFYDKQHPHHMSQTQLHFLAGVQKLLPEFLCLFAQTVNSYSRLIPGFWAPTEATWGFENRTTALRVIEGSPKSQRIEVRIGSADANPYIALAATLAAGLYGIEKQLQPSPVTKGNAYAVDHPREQHFPRTLWEAAQQLRQSDVARAYLGEEFVEHYAATREWEEREFRKHITDWELARYFEII